jgi:integrase
MHGILHRAFRDAALWGFVPASVLEKVAPPSLEDFEISPLTVAQARELIAAASYYSLDAMLTLAIATGMRQGELLSLRWADINFEERSLNVRRTLYRIKGRGIVESDPKTAKSKRRIMLPQFVVDALIIHRDCQSLLREKAGSDWRNLNVVFCTRQGGFIQPSNLRVRFKRVLKRAGLPDVRFHDLRHSAATILLGMGAHPKQVQDLLGHASFKTTMDRYSHVLPSMQRGMMDNLDNFFGQL